MPNNRIAFIDAAKAFAIFLVVFGHGLQNLNFEGHTEHFGFNLIYSFHMPLFMIMSGLFFASSLRKPFGQMLAAKCRTLLLPSVVWSMPLVSYFLLVHKQNEAVGGGISWHLVSEVRIL